MRPYEAMVIFDTGADEAAVNGVLDRALDALRAKGGNPGPGRALGPADLRLRGPAQARGLLRDHRAHLRAAAVADMERVFVLADEVLRHKVMRLPDKVAGRRAAAAASSSRED